MPNYQAEARRAARRYGLDPAIFTRQIRQESGFNPNVTSRAGAIGIAQIMPATAKGWGVNPRDPMASLDAAARNMASYVKKYGGYRNALIAYNAGPGAVGRTSLPAETSHYIDTILGGSDPGKLGNPQGGGNANALTNAASTPGAGNQPQGSEGILALVSALAESKQSPASSGLQAPSFSAAPAMPAGAAVPSSSGGPAPKQDTTALLDAIRTVGGDVQHAPGTTGAQASTAGTGGTQPGKVIVNPGANRAGVPIQPGPLKFARKIAGLVGEPVHIGTGTRHDQMTVSGNVSDHWRGEGIDIPGSGSQLVKLGQAALIAAGMPAAQARKQKGGAYRVGGKQIIFASNLPGYGDHTDHLHVGLSRRRG